MLIVISSRLTEVALPIIVGAEKHVFLSCLTDVTPVPPQYASYGRFYFVGAWSLALLDNTTRFPSLGDRVTCTDVFSMRKCCQVSDTTSVMSFFGSDLSLVEASANFAFLAISHLLPLTFHVATGKFDTTLRPYSSSAGDGRWLSISVALSTSRAIWTSDRGPTFFKVCFTVCTCRSMKPFD